MSLSNTKTIDILTREKLIIIAQKLKIKGANNNFKSPYLKKDEIKKIIVLTINKKKKEARDKKNIQINPNPTICNSNDSPNLFPKVKKLVAIGDIHGDLSVAIKSLKLANVISHDIPNNTLNVNNIQWIGGNTHVVQLGDQIDRCRPSKWDNEICSNDDEALYQDEGSDLKILCLFDNLHKQAIKVGGALFSILGNHELMNVDGDFRYVSPREFREFGNFFKAKKTIKRNSFLPFGYKERKDAFKPGGIIAKKLALTRFSILQVGSWVFVHGGISPDMAKKYSIDKVNKCVYNWLVGIKDEQNDRDVKDLYHNDDDTFSPFWSRMFSDDEEWEGKNSEKLFNKTMNNLNETNNRNEDTKIKGMVMGHSPQYMFDKGINSDCNNKLWRTDVGMSRAFGPLNNNDNETKYRKVQILVIEDDEKCSVIKEK